MQCPVCQHESTRVIDSRDVEGERAIRRRRECESCEHRFTTYERIELGNLTIEKKGGTRELYDRTKLERGLWKALEKRPVSPEKVAALIERLEEQWRSAGVTSLTSREIGEAVMSMLRELDEVAYIRFASIYREFKDVEDFKNEIGRLFQPGEKPGEKPGKNA